MFARAALSALAFAAILPSTLANIYVTSPVKGTSWAAGQNQTISWIDSGVSPSLAQFGNAKVSVYVGNQIDQTSVQEIVPSVDVSTTSSIVFTPNPGAGENGEYYFVRFESLALKDANNSAYPAEAFSATFSLSGMTGTFNASVQSEINGASTAPISAPSSAPSAATSHIATTPVAKSAAATSANPSASASQSIAAGAANGAMGMHGASGMMVAGVLAAVGAMLF